MDYLQALAGAFFGMKLTAIDVARAHRGTEFQSAIARETKNVFAFFGSQNIRVYKVGI